MAATKITIAKGEDKTIELTVDDGDGGVIDLTNGLVTFTVKYTTDSSTNLFQKTSATPSEITITSPTTGRADIYILPADTSGLDAATYVYDIWVTLASGKEYQVVNVSDFKVEDVVTVL